MRLGSLSELVGGFQQGQEWSQQQAEAAAQRKAQIANGLAMLAEMQKVRQAPQGTPAGTGMTPDQAAGAAQTAQGVAQTVGWPQQAGPGGPVAPNAVPLSPARPGALNPQAIAAMKTVMSQGGGGQPQQPQQPQQLPVPSAPSMAQPSPKQPPVPNLSSTAQPDAAGMDDPIKAAQQLIMSIAQGIKAANPNIDPRTLALAVGQQIDQIKGVSPLTRAAMTAQIQTVKLQQDWALKQERMAQIDRDTDIKARNATTAEEKVRIYEEGVKLKDATMRYGIETRAETAREGNAARLTAAEISAGARKYAADKGYQRGVDVAGINQDGADARARARGEQARGAAAVSAYTRAYAAVMANTPNATPEMAAAAAEAAADAAAAHVPQGSPLGGNRPAPRAAGGGRPSTSAGGPRVGEVRQGYRYMGGDPSNPSSWKKVAG